MQHYATPHAVPDHQAIDFGRGGRLRIDGLSSGDRTYVLWMHLSTLIGFLVILGPLAFIIPLVMWQTRKSTGAFVDDHGREIMNLWLTGAGLFVIGILTGIGALFWLVWCIVQIVSIVRACIAANESEYFRYPMVGRMLS